MIKSQEKMYHEISITFSSRVIWATRAEAFLKESAHVPVPVMLAYTKKWVSTCGDVIPNKERLRIQTYEMGRRVATRHRNRHRP